MVRSLARLCRWRCGSDRGMLFLDVQSARHHYGIVPCLQHVSDMLRMRKRFTEMLGRKHTETMRKYSQFKTAEDENEAYELWRERREREPKRLKVEPQQFRMHCPACAAQGW